jgi:hypothetical protein
MNQTATTVRLKEHHAETQILTETQRRTAEAAAEARFYQTDLLTGL